MTDELDLDALAAELADFAPPEKKTGRSARDERIIAGFEEIQRFVDEHGHAPRHGEELNIFERLYAVRLDRLREQEDCRALLLPLDRQGLLTGELVQTVDDHADMDTDALFAELEGVMGGSELTELRHVRTAEEKRAAEEIANRQRCVDFATFKPLFDQVQSELDAGIRSSRPFEIQAEIRPGAWFIVGGQKAYVADMDEMFTNAQGRTDARLRVIFDNGTESNMLMRSLQRALHRDDAGRRITEPVAGPLFVQEEPTAFSWEPVEDDLASGTIYVLRSKSEHPVVAENRDLLHKIGVTGGDVKRRVANARFEPTYLMADVEVVATYELYNINRSKLENLLHKVFSAARAQIEIKDRFGRPITPREWFLVPLFTIDEVVSRIQDGSITEYEYDPTSAKLVQSRWSA